MFIFLRLWQQISMSKFKFINIIDKLFVSICIFLIIYAWINFYIRELWPTFILSLIFSSAIIYVVYFLIEKKQSKKLIKQQKVEEIDKTLLNFQLLATSEQLSLLKTIFSQDYKTEVIGNYLRYEKDGKLHLVAPAPNFYQLTEQDLINILKDAKNIEFDEILILCTKIENVIKIRKYNKKPIKIYEKIDIFCNLFEKYKIFPEITDIDIIREKLKFKDILLAFFIPQKAKGYFFCGLILIFSSIILPYYIYYTVMGSLLLLFSIICKLLPKITSLYKSSLKHKLDD